jgi:hypothetical protein
MTQANMLRNQEAKGEIERMGPTPAVLGRQESAGQSGRARLVSQQAGLTELARPLARLSNWELRVYRQIWMRAKQFKTDPWFIRVTNDVRAPEFLTVNEPVMGMVMQPVAGPMVSLSLNPETGQPCRTALRSMGVVSMNHRLAELDVDIILDTVADTATWRRKCGQSLSSWLGRLAGFRWSTPLHSN